MNENESERGEQEEPDVEPEVNDQPRPNATGSNQRRQNNRSQGDIILQGMTHQDMTHQKMTHSLVHIANIFLTFCQRYARFCNRKIRRCLEFIVLVKVSTTLKVINK